VVRLREGDRRRTRYPFRRQRKTALADGKSALARAYKRRRRSLSSFCRPPERVSAEEAFGRLPFLFLALPAKHFGGNDAGEFEDGMRVVTGHALLFSFPSPPV